MSDQGNIEFTNDDNEANFVHFKDSEMMNKEKEKFQKEKFLKKLSFRNQSNATHAKGKTVGSARYLDFAEPKQSPSLATAEVTRSQGNKS
jgi:DNA modification methylase